MIRSMKAQGDLLFIPVPSVPRQAKRRTESEQGRHILARGEATGHHHSVPVTCPVLDEGGVTYLTVEELTEVAHQEHAPVVLEPGAWRVQRQREFGWWDEESRTMAD